MVPGQSQILSKVPPWPKQHHPVTQHPQSKNQAWVRSFATPFCKSNTFNEKRYSRGPVEEWQLLFGPSPSGSSMLHSSSFWIQWDPNTAPRPAKCPLSSRLLLSPLCPMLTSARCGADHPNTIRSYKGFRPCICSADAGSGKPCWWKAISLCTNA